MILQRRTVRAFTPKQMELATTFADQAVIAIENVRLFDEVQARTRELSEALEQQTGTSEVLQVDSRSPGELEPVFLAMLSNAVRVCEAKFGVLFRYSDNEFHAAATLDVPPAYAEFLGRRSFRPDVEPALAGSPFIVSCCRRTLFRATMFHWKRIPDLRVSTGEHGPLLPYP